MTPRPKPTPRPVQPDASEARRIMERAIARAKASARKVPLKRPP